MTNLERTFHKLVREHGVAADFYAFDGKFRRATLNHPAWKTRYELTYLPKQELAALAFLWWLVSHRLQLGWDVPPEAGLGLLVPRMPAMDPRSDECRYAWTSAAWEMCEAGRPTASP